MLVALYQDHHQLPWWEGRTNPFDVFDPEKCKSLPFKGESIIEERKGERRIVGYETIPLEEVKDLFSFLVGLHNVEAGHLMAHVSALCGCELEKYGWWHYPKRVWVQITTMPDEFTEDGIPVVYDMMRKRKPEILHAWGVDNGTYHPTEFFLDKKLGEMADADSKIWTRFFIEQLDLDLQLVSLKDELRAAQALVEEVSQKVEKVQIFGRDKLNTDLNESFNAV